MKTRGAALPVIGNPVSCHRITDPEQVTQLRRIDCRAYDQCLDLAVKRGWRGFHCNECKGFQPPTPDEQRRDMMGALTLLADTQLLPSLLVPEPVFVDETNEDEGEDEDEDEDENEPVAAGAPTCATAACN